MNAVLSPAAGRDESVEQLLFTVPTDAEEYERLREQVIRGAYRLVDHSSETGYQPGKNVVHIFAVGAMISGAASAGAPSTRSARVAWFCNEPSGARRSRQCTTAFAK